MTANDLDLLQRYAWQNSEAAFATLVERHLNLVYSAALRQVRSPQLAEEIAQSVFTDLARAADKLKPETILTAWLYQVTRRTAIDVVRREARRQLREQIATEMNTMNATAADWTHIEPLLDEAMHALDDTDRTAVLLRYFENKSLREVGQTLGTSDDTAQKRVSRAVERLREFFTKRGVTVGVSGLAVVISANAVQAAPVGLAATISTTAVLTGTTLAPTATTATIKTIAMTTLTKTLVTATLATVALTTVLLLRRSDSASSPKAQITLQTNNAVIPKTRSDSAFWRRVQEARQARKTETAADVSLREALARLNVALYGPLAPNGTTKDAARDILYAIPLEQRAAALDMVMQALRDPNKHVCLRAIRLVPLIWPQGEAALPTLFELIRSKSTEWPEVASEALMASVQVRSNPDIVPELIAAAMQGPDTAQHALAAQLLLLKSQIKEGDVVFAASLQPFLNSPDANARLTAAQALAQLRGTKDAAVVTELAASLANPGTTRAETARLRASLDALWKMGPEASDAIPALLACANLNADLRDSALMVLKAIAPEALKGVGTSTPLPPRDGTAKAIAQHLADGTWTVQNAADALNTPATMLSAARALADLGTEAAAALPALEQAFDAQVRTNLSVALVLGAVIERLNPAAPKPLLMMTDLMPALEAVQAEARRADLPEWDEALETLPQRVPLGMAFRHDDVRLLAAELGRIDPRLLEAFRAKLLESDAKFAVILQPRKKN